jgi:hypothetical protein
VAVIAAVAIAAGKPGAGGGDLTLQFAGAASSAVSIAERMIADNSVGTGVGTFGALLPIYRESADVGMPTSAPTAAAQITIEMGHLGLWTIIVMMVAATALLLRGAVSRGRDSFYATGAAGGAIALMAEAFIDASFFSTAIVILAMSLLGLGLAQSASRTAQ